MTNEPEIVTREQVIGSGSESCRLLNDYGWCPVCGAPCHERERRLGGNDKCKLGHIYPSRDAMTWEERSDRLAEHPAMLEGKQTANFVFNPKP